MVDSDRMVGTVKSVFGKTEKELGKAAGDASTSASGATTQAEGIIQNAAGQIKDVAKETAENMSNVSAAAYDKGSELVARNPGGALLLAGAIGFAFGVMMTQGSRPRRNTLQRYYDRYGG
jgi:uncharacterized protein YjbJ (UPF0337 family)